jgi:outer membrane protein OmpA-like peptidoglycan-associated protein
VALEVIGGAEKAYETNDPRRAIAVEHGALAVHTSLLQIISVAVVLMLSATSEAGRRREPEVRVGSVYFERNDVTLDSNDRALLRGLAIGSLRKRETRLRLEGYSDSSGVERFKLSVSETRARMVGDCLVRLGVDPSRITTVGLGASLDGGRDDLERRVDIIEIEGTD